MPLPRMLFIAQLLFAGLTGASVQAQTERPPQSLLWTISKNSAPVSYIFGTMHALCPQDTKLKPHVENALAHVEQVVMEVDMDDPTLLEQMTSQMMNAAQEAHDEPTTKSKKPSRRRSQHHRAAKRSSSVSLRAQLGKEYQFVKAFFQDSLSVPFAALETLGSTPAMLAMMLIPKALGCEPSSVEEALVERVQAERQRRGVPMEIVGLERIEQQMALVKSVPETDAMEELVAMVKDFSSTKAKMRDLARLYTSEHLDSIQLLLGELPGSMAKALLVERNAAWLPAMEEHIRRKATLFAVGAAHLPGEQGLLALLRRRGFVVEPVLPRSEQLPPHYIKEKEEE